LRKGCLTKEGEGKEGQEAKRGGGKKNRRVTKSKKGGKRGEIHWRVIYRHLGEFITKKRGVTENKDDKKKT